MHGPIPARPRRPKTVVARTRYRLEMCRVLDEPGDRASRRAYRRRREVETVMSVTKRKWGEALTARTDPTQEIQALLRSVACNLHRLILLDAA